jgi:hypothetical protein
VAAIAIVVAASRATERAGPFVGGMIATLPVSTGPVYVFLAIDHGAQFVSESARMSVASTAAIVAFVAVHAHAAQRFGTLRSLGLATLAWLAVALLLQLRDWHFAEVCVLFVAAFGAAIFGLRRYAEVTESPRIPRARYDLALRALLVALVVLATTAAAQTLGPAATGVVATYPVVFTSLILILQPRCGGPFTAAMLVNGLKGLLGFGVALVVLHLAAARMSAAPALLLALAVSLGWNGALYGLRVLRRPRRAAG